MGANNSDPLGIVRVLFAMSFPKLAKLLDIPFGNREAIEFFVQIIRYVTFLLLIFVVVYELWKNILCLSHLQN